MMKLEPLVCVALAFASSAAAQSVDDITPRCDTIGVERSNDCAAACVEAGSTMNLKESRDVNGMFKCFCGESTKPVCNDDPVCSDLLIVPGLAAERCAAICPQDAVIEALDDVQFAGDTTAANKNQTHLRVNCYCDTVMQCDDEYILFSDLSFLQACSSGHSDPNPLGINNAEECQDFCVANTFDSGSYTAGKCECSNSEGTAVACDDARANSQRPDSIGCFEQVGVSGISCPPTEAPTTMSGGAINYHSAAVIATTIATMAAALVV